MNAQTWYQALKKPYWAPDEKVFGQVWSKIYVIIAAVNVGVLTLLIQGKITWRVALPFWLNLFFNILFTPIQFGLKNNWLALLDIVLVLVTIIWSMIAIWDYNRFLSIAYLPYLVWVCIATALQFSITWLNR